MSNILDRRFKYVNSAKTNIRRTFRRVRRELREQAERDAQERQQKVAAIGGARRKP